MRKWIVLPALSALLTCTAAHAVVDIDHAVDEIGNGVLILDLRNDSDFAAGNIHNSLQVDMTIRKMSSEIDTRGLAYQLGRVVEDKNRTVVIYSDTNEHALSAERTLAQRGYMNIVNGGNYTELNAALFRLCQSDSFYC
ncbi:MAG: rhodanese-like domain-containing protein [Pseudomonas sp.]|uniref:rhodanese-like domain-containing protein n=1 Tax=Pseudomonas abieticivorans TaxID=2931382 RepID=UPI0020C0390F|nr:rhodanese-like domain-containing protein [Pseudomonas sp. PIA16]MDE1164176.1 rhodanese-like domain-containing protein [Pseudomonas sp.]